jgi:hypothetical protein
MSVMTSWMPRTLLKNSDGLVGVEGSDHCVAAAFQNGRLGRGEKPKVSRMPMPSPASKRSMLARCPAPGSQILAYQILVLDCKNNHATRTG